MLESPNSLQDLCIDVICDNLHDIFESCLVQVDIDVHNSMNDEEMFLHKTTTQNMFFDTQQIHEPTNMLRTTNKLKYKFKEKNQFLCEVLSQSLFDRMVCKGLLNDETITLFSPNNTKLFHIKLKDVLKLTTKGLIQISNHKIVNLECVNMSISVPDVIRCLSEWSIQNLKYLNISHSIFDSYNYSPIISISQLKNLRILNVSDTEFNTHALEIICDDLIHLQSLNISNTRVVDIKPLIKLKNQLQCLSMFNLITASYDSTMIPVIIQLNNLTYLDISCEPPGMSPFEIISRVCDLDNLLKNVNALPNLIYLDMSGKQDMEMNYLSEFILSHPKLTFLGLMFNNCCLNEMFINPNHIHYQKNLTVAGMTDEKQILTSLKMYTDRANYVQKSLYYLFRLSPTLNEPRADIINLVLPAMANHPKQFGVQMAATACLYNLTKGEFASKIHPNLLKNVVNLTIDAMHNFPSQIQIQKNALLTLCSDRILQEVNFEKFRCAKLVIMALCSTDDPSMNRMAVAIISILASKITTEETSIIGSVPMYMKKLLSMIKDKVNERNCDITMKFTLSALWNLTDESSITCSVFLQEGGINLFLDVLMTFAGESSIETKVLGLINNIAEVQELRHQLMIPNLINKLQCLLQSEHIDVSYFAAGIIAHLASDGEEKWGVKETPRSFMLDSLGHVVSNWKTPDIEMVAYRTFRPFFPLLKSVDNQIQLWAVWAIHHVCTKNPKRYCQMLFEEGGNILLETILENTDTDLPIRQLATIILETVQTEKINL